MVFKNPASVKEMTNMRYAMIEILIRILIDLLHRAHNLHKEVKKKKFVEFKIFLAWQEGRQGRGAYAHVHMFMSNQRLQASKISQGRGGGPMLVHCSAGVGQLLKRDALHFIILIQMAYLP